MPTLIVEDGSGVTDSNTYIDVAYCDTYCDNLNYTSWAALTETVKEQSILRAMNYIEPLNWKGYKSDQDYSLEWPRTSVEDRNGYSLDDDYMPPNLLKAQAEAAYRESVTEGTMTPDLEGPSNIRQMKAGTLGLEYFDNKSESEPIYTVIEGLLYGLLISGSKVRRT